MKIVKEKARKLPIMFPIKFSEIDGNNLPTRIHVIPTGQWDHPVYGEMLITASDIQEFKTNFDGGIRKDIPITAGHEGMTGEKPAVGWFKQVYAEGESGLWADVEWTADGKDLLSKKNFKYFSPEFYSDSPYVDQETGEMAHNVLVGGALTNKPYFKELTAIVMSEPKISNQFNFNEITMDLKTITNKNPAELSVEETAFLVEHKAELSADQKVEFADVLPVEAPTADEKAKADADAAAEAAKDDKGTTPEEDDAKGKGDHQTQKNASEPVMIAASELAALKEAANKGMRAFAELEEKKLAEMVSVMTFSEKNKEEGKFLPATAPKVSAFLKTLSEKQRKSFSDIVKELPKSQMFKEVGTSEEHEVSTDAVKVFNEKVKALQESDKSVGYADAVKKVFAENPKLQSAYEVQIAKTKTESEE